MTGDIATFELDLHKAAEALGVGFMDAVKKTVFELDANIVSRTPVDKGTARGNWQASAGGDDPPFHSDPSFKGGPSEAAGNSLQTVQGLNFGEPEIFWFSNFLPYIEVLELGLYPGDGPKTVGGFSTQAPAGMVRLSIAETEERLGDALEQALRAKGL